MKRLSPAQRAFLGLPADEGRLVSSEEGLHQVERRFRARFRSLKLEKAELGLDGDTVRQLLGRLARGLMAVPFGGKVSVNEDKLDEIIGEGDDCQAFKEIATGIGTLVEEPKGYFRFADIETFDYFTSIGAGSSLPGRPHP